MNKKVDEEFKYIHDEYVLQCTCTQMKDKINNAIEWGKYNLDRYQWQQLEKILKGSKNVEN